MPDEPKGSEIFQTTFFKVALERLSEEDKALVDEQVGLLLSKKVLGEKKKGAFKHLMTIRFDINGRHYVLIYGVKDPILTLYHLGLARK